MKLKISLRPGTKLSDSFANTRDCYKIVEDYVLGYVVSNGGPKGAATIYPIYRADIHIKTGKTWRIISSFEHGERLNDFTFIEDYEGCTFATIASQAINALQERKHVRDLARIRQYGRARAGITGTKKRSKSKRRSADTTGRR